MPYYRHLKTAEPETGTPFDNMPSARDGIGPDEKVTFIASEDEQFQWTEREQRRFYDGLYVATPWAKHLGYSYWDTGSKDYGRSGANPAVSLHYAHLSVSSPGLVAYTKSIEHGVQDRQTRVKPGKYLEEFYKDRFTPDEIAEFIAQCKAEHLALQLATSTEDIVAIYSRKDLGFSSCMQFKRSPEYPFQRPTENGEREHPCAVYGGSDLAVAYLGDIDGKLTARSVVWPDQKVYTRVYGDETLTAILKANGYEHGTLRNAKVRAIRYNGDWILPYVDGLSYAEVSADKKWIVLGSGPLSCDNTSGYGGHTTDDEPEEDHDYDDDDLTCDHCGDRYSYGSQRHGALNHTWCDDCIDGSTVCAECDTRTWDDTTTVDGDEWCDDCLARAEVQCTHEAISLKSVGATYSSLVQCAETWVNQLEFTEDERDEREALGVSDLCRTHAEHVQKCKHCGHLFNVESTACSACGLAIKCEHTPRFAFADVADVIMESIAASDATDLEALTSPIDGSLWWTSTDDSRHIPRSTYWVLFANGDTYYTDDNGHTFNESTFDTLDDSALFVRVADPRLSLATATVQTSQSVALESSPF
jgi:hypothetical protein